MRENDIIDYPDFEQNRIQHEKRRKNKIVKNTFFVFACILSVFALGLFLVSQAGMYFKGYIVISKTFLCHVGIQCLSMGLIALFSLLFIKSERLKPILWIVGLMQIVLYGYYMYRSFDLIIDYKIYSYLFMYLFGIFTGISLCLAGFNFFKKTVWLSGIPFINAVINLYFVCNILKNIVSNGISESIAVYFTLSEMVAMLLFWGAVFFLMLGLNKKYMSKNNADTCNSPVSKPEPVEANKTPGFEEEHKPTYAADYCAKDGEEPEKKYDQYNRF